MSRGRNESIYLDAKLLQDLQEIAKEDGGDVVVATVVRRILSDYVAAVKRLKEKEEVKP